MSSNVSANSPEAICQFVLLLQPVLMLTNNITVGPDVISPTGEILQAPSYGYLLDKTACIIFVALFGVSTGENGAFYNNCSC